jgi:hypothetical protein
VNPFRVCEVVKGNPSLKPRFSKLRKIIMIKIYSISVNFALFGFYPRPLNAGPPSIMVHLQNKLKILLIVIHMSSSPPQRKITQGTTKSLVITDTTSPKETFRKTEKTFLAHNKSLLKQEQQLY